MFVEGISFRNSFRLFGFLRFLDFVRQPTTVNQRKEKANLNINRQQLRSKRLCWTSWNP